MEGSFGTGRLNTACLVSLHASSPLQDETLSEVTEAAYAVNKGGTVRNRPLLMKIGKGLFDVHEKVKMPKQEGERYEQRTGKKL